MVKPTRQKKASGVEIIRQFRAALRHAECTGFTSMGDSPPGYFPFVDWMINNKSHTTIATSLQMVTELGTNSEDLRNALNVGHFRQLFSIALTCHTACVDNDTRLGELVDRSFEPSCPCPMTLALLTAKLFCSGTEKKSKTDMLKRVSWSRPPIGKQFDLYKTVKPTTFELLMFVFSLGKLCGRESVQTTHGKRLRTRRTVLPGQKRNREMGQAAGSAVQAVIRGWDWLAQTMGFQGMEEMVWPYVQCKKDAFRVDVLEKRTEGFARNKTRLTLEDCSPTLDENECEKAAWERTPEVDEKLRFLARAFVDDIDEIVINPELYNLKDCKLWEPLSHFTIMSSGIPSRFQKWERDICNFLRKELVGAPLSEVLSQKLQDEPNPTTLEPISSPYPGEAGPVEFLNDPKRDKRLQPTPGDDIVGSSVGADEAVIETSKSTVHPDDAAGLVDADPEWEELFSKHSNKDLDQKDRSADEFEEEPGPAIRCLENNCECEGARKLLAQAMNPYARVHLGSFVDLLSIDMILSEGTDIEGQVQLILTDPPYNTRRVQHLNNSGHDNLTLGMITACVESANTLLRPGGHCIIFCTSYQFKLWSDAFSKVELEEDGNKTPQFIVDGATLNFTKATGHFFGSPKRLSTTPENYQEKAIHVVKRGAGRVAASMVQYRCFGHVPSSNHGRCNTIDNVPRLGHGEQLRIIHHGKNVPLFPEQKSVHLIREIICRYSKPGDLVIDYFGGTFSVGQACLSLPRHCKYVATEVKKDCFTIAHRRIVEAFSKALFNPKCDVKVPGVEPEKLAESAKLVSLHSSSVIEHPDWRAPKGFPSYQSFPHYFLPALATLWGYAEVLLKCRKPFETWPQHYQGEFHATPVESLLAVETSHLKVLVARSTIKHHQSGKGLFATKQFRRHEKIMPLYGTLVYEDLQLSESSTKSYGTGVMGVRRADFVQFRVKVPIITAQTTEVERDIAKVYVVPPKFCVSRYINDPGYYDGDEDGRPERKTRSSNVNIIRKPVRSPRELSNNDLVTLHATRNIEPGEEMFFSYEHEVYLK